jgi:TonB family protein
MYTRHEVAAPREVGPSGRTKLLKIRRPPPIKPLYQEVSLAIPHRISSRLLLLGCLALCAAPAFADGIHRAVVTRVAPIYPEIARRMHLGGKVVLLVTIQANGTVSATKVESGHALLIMAAEDAVRHWRFSSNSDITESEIEVNFNLAGQ